MADGHTFNYLADEGYVYLVVADEAYGRQIPFACLERIKDEFKSQYGGRATDAIAHSLDRSFGPKIKAQMEYCANNQQELTKVSRVQAQVSEVKTAIAGKERQIEGKKERVKHQEAVGKGAAADPNTIEIRQAAEKKWQKGPL